MNGCNHWLGHKWPKWGEPQERNEPAAPGVVQVSFLQRRACIRCGMVQYYVVQRLTAAKQEGS